MDGNLWQPEMEFISCDLCGNTTTIPLYGLTDTFHDLPGEFTLCRCTNCGLMYLNPRPTAQSLLHYYPEHYTNYRPPIAAEPCGLMRWIRRHKLLRRRQVVERYSGQTSGKILDVGCSTGLFLYEMQQAGWEVAGIEPVAAAALQAQRLGASVFIGTLEEAPYPPETFDALTFWDVLEHTVSPTRALAKAASLLRPGGTLLVSVPNWQSVGRFVFGPCWQGLDPPRHLYVFTRPTLTQLLARAGLQIQNWVCFMPGYFVTTMSIYRWLKQHAPALATPVARILALPGMRFPFEPWFLVNNWLKKGPIITVVAHKPQQ